MKSSNKTEHGFFRFGSPKVRTIEQQENDLIYKFSEILGLYNEAKELYFVGAIPYSTYAKAINCVLYSFETYKRRERSLKAQKELFLYGFTLPF